ncbi:ERF family protein [Terrisporobacter sp.]|uniref:ERF family protein n=1 Tax=Terrisporobacter sp. TaxID=1965305 RepID=UPI0028A075B1|nr:ERF family protein [Terrisporobacter sp.]
MENINENVISEEIVMEDENVKTITSGFWMSKEVDKILPAMLEFHKKVDVIKMDKENSFFKNKYADLSTILSTVSEPLTECGIFIIQIPTDCPYDEDKMYVETRLIHAESGQYIAANSMSLKKGKDAQSLVAFGTYAKRSSINSILAIAMEVDNDGNDIEGTKPSQSNRTDTTEPPSSRRRR